MKKLTSGLLILNFTSLAYGMLETYARSYTFDTAAFAKRTRTAKTQSDLSLLVQEQLKAAVYVTERINWDIGQYDSLQSNIAPLIQPVRIVQFDKFYNEFFEEEYSTETKWLSNFIFSLVMLQICPPRDERDFVSKGLRLIGILLTDLEEFNDQDIKTLMVKQPLTLKTQKQLLQKNMQSLQNIFKIINIAQLPLGHSKLDLLHRIYSSLNPLMLATGIPILYSCSSDQKLEERLAGFQKTLGLYTNITLPRT